MVSRNINRKAMHNLIVCVCIVLLFTFLVVSITVEGNSLNTITGNAPGPAVCTDYDEARGNVNMQALVKSFVLFEDIQNYDTCVKDYFGGDKTSTNLNEQTCNRVKGKLKLVSVGVDCADLNKVCEEGACVAAPPDSAQRCNRNDDCIKGLCFSHICQTLACSETDGGNFPRVAGVLTLDYSISEDTANKDTCQDEAQVIEYFCSLNGGSSTEVVPCPRGTTCQMNAEQVGACVAAPLIVGGGDGNNQHQETDDNTAGTSNYFRRMERFNTLMRR